MVITILENATTFTGIEYNSNKEEKNRAQLMSATNIPENHRTPEDFENYLNHVSDMNPRVKNKQFHVSISTKEKDHSFKELEDIAKDYIKYMGYQENPYLIYSHNDTNNNHVHIVTTRVNPSGEKIPDSLERARTQSYIENKLQIHFSNDVKQIVKESLNYNFEHLESFQALLKKEGYKSRRKNNVLEVIKSGKVQQTVPWRKIKDKMFYNKADFGRIKQIRNHLHKFSKGTNFDKLQSDIRENFGLEIIYSYTTTQNKQNQENRKRNVSDYNLIDHKAKTAYSSQQLLSLQELKEKFKDIYTKQNLADDIREIKSKPKAYFEAKNFFRKHDLSLDKEGNISNVPGEVLGILDRITMDRLKYNQRLEDSKKVNCTENTNETTLARIYRIDPKDVRLSPKNIKGETLKNYTDYINSYLNRNLDSPRDSDDIKIYRNNTGDVLVDRKNATVLNIQKDLGIKIPEIKKVNIPDFCSKENKPFYPSKGPGSLQLLPVDEPGTDEAARKKKKKRQQGISF